MINRKTAKHPAVGTRLAFTLLELLTAIAILGVIITILVSAFQSASTVTIRNENKTEVNQAVRAVLDQITRDIERTVNLTTAVNMYCPGSGGNLIPGIPTNALFFLSDLPAPEPNPYGSYVNVGYQIAKTNISGMTDRWVLMRGDDPNVDTGTYPSAWWTTFNPNTTSTNELAYNPCYWKPLSENILGIQFAFYSNSLDSAKFSAPNADTSNTVWNSTTVPNPIPLSVKVTLYVIDTDTYNKALRIDANLGGVATTLITNNVRTYTARIFLPSSSAN